MLHLSICRLMSALLLALGVGALASPARAADKLVFMTSWYAQAEHGGFYQALASGLYEEEGLDVTIKMGGPQVNSMQLLLAGEADVYSGFDFRILSGVARDLPLVAIAAVFQHDMNGLITHPDVTGLDDIGDRSILMSASARNSWWPWLRDKYGLSDDQVKRYTFNIQPFIRDPNAVQQAFGSSEPFVLKDMNVPYRFYAFADQGYPPYGSTITTRRDVLVEKPDQLRRFLRASLKGWRDYLKDPALGNALIKQENPKMTDQQLAFAVHHLRQANAVGSGDAAEQGIGTITRERWRATYQYMVGAGLLPEDTDWESAFTTDLIDGLGVMPTASQ
ncbi:ABC transporter substrate-binding protein [Alloalcanivorax gelatiniphagus]|uniref:ABC transporter substrate-binding protein n=1 Tax=Alloalcanivorax gelatiniphagus TaxID=1194167 RepID=A0ABY2XPS0_9GAMM|nr:ABC transporter substrate-binding protein [Alloalcanivorax gelatiniphagus]TMW13688.1 ABC transporter substrate-binding protein [Alloalcanivorax gelatiniphagus]